MNIIQRILWLLGVALIMFTLYHEFTASFDTLVGFGAALLLFQWAHKSKTGDWFY